MSFSVAIDGPAASGKSTIAKELANGMGLVHIDTGAMYRAITYLCLKRGIDCQNIPQVNALLPEINIELTLDEKVFINGEDVTTAIRSSEVSDNVSYIAAIKEVRLFLVDLQREMTKNLSIVMDGRDIGTYVLPQAEIKIFMIASVEKRAMRRYLENQKMGRTGNYEEILSNLKKRDYIDSHRDFAPLKPAEDSIILDTSDLSIPEVVTACKKIISNKLGKEIV
ncbi:MAG: (d)CMP kinase [Bacilli bacterium]|nr:(d)CMP kinase [Bacilli bacterium]